MKFVKFAPHAGMIAVLAAILQYVSTIPAISSYLVTWAVFQTWALYFLTGANPKAGFKAVMCGILGAALSIAIVQIGQALIPAVGAQMAFTIACGVVAFFVICFELTPPLNTVPAFFIGAGIFFGLPSTSLSFKLLQVSIALVAGMGFGFATVVLRTKYAAMLAASEKKAAEAEAELVAA